MNRHEEILQQKCYVWFHNGYPELRGTMWLVHNNAKDGREGAKLKAMGMVKGVSDMSWLHGGKYYGIEFKTETGRQSAEQKKWEQAITAQGGVYVLIRSFEEFCTFVQNIVQ
jgi:hypothetical protein